MQDFVHPQVSEAKAREPQPRASVDLWLGTVDLIAANAAAASARAVSQVHLYLVHFGERRAPDISCIGLLNKCLAFRKRVDE